MLHARIRTPRDSFHFIAEVTPYNLQTLRQHVRQSLREGGPLSISMRIDRSDQGAFDRFTATWLPALVQSGTQVVVDVARATGGALPPHLRMAPTMRSNGFDHSSSRR